LPLLLPLTTKVPAIMSSSELAATPDESIQKPPLDTAEKVLPQKLEVDSIGDDDIVDDGYHGQFTRKDKRDMQRMGKVQELKRNFRSFSVMSFTIVLQNTWEVLLVQVNHIQFRSLTRQLTISSSATTQGLIDGGLAGLFWSYIWTFFGFSMVVISLAEMASMSVDKIYSSLHLYGNLTSE
jgi:hypothetical protein